MAVNDKTYFGMYCRLDTSDGDQVAAPHGDRMAVGQEIKLDYEAYVNERGKDATRVMVRNLADEVIGFLPYREARHIFELHEAGWTCRVAVSAVGFHEADRSYFAEAGIVCYEPEFATQFEPFTLAILKRMSAGERPALNLSEKTVERVLEGEDVQGAIKGTRPPKLPKGEAYYKTRRSSSEKMIIAASERKVGCYIGGIAVLVVVVAAVVFITGKLFGFL